MSRIHGGSIKASTVQEMIKASYNNNQGYDSIGIYNKDKSLSNNEVLCYYTLPPRQDPQAVAVFRGTEGTLTDWSNNAKYAVGAYETTDRLKRATDAFNKIIAKYGRQNTSLIGHSQSAVITRKLGQGAKEVINLNGANLGEKSLDNEYNVRSSTDVVSQVKPIADVYNKVQDTKKNALKTVANVFLPKKQQFKMAKDTSKQNTTIAGGYNPVEEHMPGIIDRIDPDKMIGKGISHNDSVITGGQVIRTPLPEHIMEVINKSTAGMLKERLKTTSYDNLYHLRIDFQTDDGIITIEKNYGSIDILHNDTRDLTSQSQRMNIGSIPQGLTIGQVLDNTRKAMGSYYTAYNALTNNCQDFIIALLKANHIGGNVNSFVKQNLYELIAPELKTIAKEGVKKVINEGLKTEQGKELVSNFEEHINKFQDINKVNGNGLKHNKEMINKINNIRMPYRKYESDTDSESDDEMKGTGIRNEEEIIRKLDKLADRIHEHQQIHGGKIHIAKAFKDMGAKVKKGFTEDIKDIKTDAKAVGHYVTSKNGLADDLTNYAIPATLGAIGGVAGEMVGGPAGGVAGSMLGTYAGDKLAGQIDKSGHMDTRGQSMKAVGGMIREPYIDNRPALMKKARGRPKKIIMDSTVSESIGSGIYDKITLEDLEKLDRLHHEHNLRKGDKAHNKKVLEQYHKLLLEAKHSNGVDGKYKKRRTIKGRGALSSGAVVEVGPLEAQLTPVERIETASVRKRGRPKGSGSGILKTISKKITLKPKAEMVDGKFSVSPDVGYKVNDNLEVNKHGFTYQLGGKGLTSDAKHFLTAGASTKSKKNAKHNGLLLLNGADATYNTGVMDMPHKFQNLGEGTGFSPTKMVNRGIMLSKKGGPMGGLARGAYLDAHGRGIMDLIKPKDKYNGDVYLGNAQKSGAYQAGMGQGNPDRLAVSGATFVAKKAIGRGVMEPAVMPDGGDLVHIDIGSHNVKPIWMPKPRGMGFKKGSQEAKDHMARIRAMKKK